MCKRGLFCGAGPGSAPFFCAQDQSQRVACDAETVADLLLQIAPVGEVQQAGVVDEKHDGGRLVAGLRGVGELEAPAFVAWRGMLEKGFAQRSEEHTSELQSRENLVC